MSFLTIAVPTYNRLRWLSMTLPVVIEQARTFPAGDIEVLVSDNCSSDGTWEYLQQLAESVPFVRLSRNEANVGAEANFYLVPKLSEGSYLWIIGDDDLLNEGTLRRVMDELKKAPDYLILNYDVYDAQLERCVRPNNLRASADMAFAKPSDCLAQIDPMAMSFISMWVGRREFFNVLSEEKFRYFANWGMSIQADRYAGISHFPVGKLISASCLRTRQNTEFPEQNYFSWFLRGSAEVLRYARQTGVLSSMDVRRSKAVLLRRSALQRIRYERRVGSFRRSDTYELLRANYGELWSFWLLCVPTMYMPGMARLLRAGRRMLGRKEE